MRCKLLGHHLWGSRRTVAAHVLDAWCRGPGKSSPASSSGPTLARYLLNVIGIGDFPSDRGRTCTCELVLIVRPSLSGTNIPRGVVGMLSLHTREYVAAEVLQLAGLLLPHHLSLKLSLHAGRFQVSKWM